MDQRSGWQARDAAAAVAAVFVASAAIAWAGSTAFTAGEALAGACDDAPAEWLACEDFESGGLGWAAWFAASPFTECLGCNGGVNDPRRIRLVNDPAAAHAGDWSLYLPAEAGAGYQGASLTWRHCDGPKRPGCRLVGHEELFFRTWVKLADDHAYVHHFLELAGTRPNGYWESDGNAGCRPEGTRWAGTTLDFNQRRELFFYTYFPQMRCDRGGYCSGNTARDICAQCAAKGMPCRGGPECCWGNHFGPEPPVVLPRGRWVCLELHMRLNTPGRADGSMAFWVDGAPAHAQAGMHWRDVADLQLNKAWLQHYIAGGDADRSNRVWFDDMVVSTARIGCGDGPPTATVTAMPPTRGVATAVPSSTAAAMPSQTATATPTAGATAPSRTETPGPVGEQTLIYLPWSASPAR